MTAVVIVVGIASAAIAQSRPSTEANCLDFSSREEAQASLGRRGCQRRLTVTSALEGNQQVPREMEAQNENCLRLGLAPLELLEALRQLGVAGGQNLNGQERRVLRSVHGHRGHWDAFGHLNDRK